MRLSVRGVPARPGHPYLAGAPLLIAHRGGSRLAPENTLAAFRRAVDWWRADVLELDVHATRDGEAVVIHDATLERTTDGSGPVAQKSLAELRGLDAGFRFTPDGGRTFPFRGRGVRIPILREVLGAFPTVRVNVEIKDGAVQGAVRREIDAADAHVRVLIAAGRRRDRAEFADYPGAVSASGEELRRFFVLHLVGLARWTPGRVDAFQMPERYGGRRVLSARLVDQAHAHNVAVHVWTVDREADMRRLLDWGVDGIVTDRPDRLARVLHEHFARPPPPGPPEGEDAWVPDG